VTGPPVAPGRDPGRYDPDAAVAYGRLGRPVPPPRDPLRDPPAAGLTTADRARLSYVRARAGWYVAAHPAATGLREAAADVRFLLGLVDRLVGADAPPPLPDHDHGDPDDPCLEVRYRRGEGVPPGPDPRPTRPTTTEEDRP
jgi:hypothetical protein